MSNARDLILIRSICSLSSANLDEVPTLLQEAAQDADPGNMYMRMFYILSAIGDSELALEMQLRALSRRQIYRLTKPVPASIELLAIAGLGDMRDNTALDFLIDGSDIQLDVLYVSHQYMPTVIPEHHVAFVTLGSADKHRALLNDIARMLDVWPRPYINHPWKILNCARDTASRLLQGIAGLHAPETYRFRHGTMPQGRFPLTIRPIDAHGGRDFRKIENQQELNAYLLKRSDIAEFFLSSFVEYRSDDGLYRKFRIALIGGQPFICHLAIADEWVVHFSSAGMESSVEKRREEELAMVNFDTDFARRHRDALKAIGERLDLDYVIIDCGETTDHQLLFFEADTVGWIHAIDPADVFPYKAPIMQKAFDAFKALLLSKH